MINVASNAVIHEFMHEAKKTIIDHDTNLSNLASNLILEFVSGIKTSRDKHHMRHIENGSSTIGIDRDKVNKKKMEHLNICFILWALFDDGQITFACCLR